VLFRSTNLQAALIYSQFNRFESLVSRSIKLHNEYVKYLDNKFKFQVEIDGAESCWWMNSIFINKFIEVSYFREVAEHILKCKGYETRPVFHPLSDMEFSDHYWNFRPPFQISDKLYNNGITLPSGPGLNLSKVKDICNIVNSIND
jgi:dTDP-4-amino-4,6-dideoxygalactose transaminase